MNEFGVEIRDGVGEVSEVVNGGSVVWVRMGSVDSEILLKTVNGCV